MRNIDDTLQKAISSMTEGRGYTVIPSNEPEEEICKGSMVEKDPETSGELPKTDPDIMDVDGIVKSYLNWRLTGTR